MEAIRYVMAVMLITFIPAAILFWCLVHPFAQFWRKFGRSRSYLVICSMLVVVMALLFLARQQLLASSWPGHPALDVAGIVCLILSGWLRLRIAPHLPVRLLVGMPELAATKETELVTSGIYGRIRHPRYLQMDLALAGYAMIAGYPAAYGALLLWLVGIRFVVFLEERELLRRFGDEYRRYCEQVPRFIPKFPAGMPTAPPPEDGDA